MYSQEMSSFKNRRRKKKRESAITIHMRAIHHMKILHICLKVSIPISKCSKIKPSISSPRCRHTAIRHRGL